MRLAEFIQDPQVEVRVASFNSQKVVVTGRIGASGTLPITNLPLTLLEAVNTLGGFKDNAEEEAVLLTRNGVTYSVDMSALLSGKRNFQNPVLIGGDVVNVPAREDLHAYVFGEVNEPGTIVLDNKGSSLTDAIGASGGLDEEAADAKGIFVIRLAPGSQHTKIFQLDATRPMAFALATKFTLHPDDVVYVVTDPVSQWNAVITQILPSFAAIRGVQQIGN